MGEIEYYTRKENYNLTCLVCTDGGIFPGKAYIYKITGKVDKFEFKAHLEMSRLIIRQIWEF